MNRFFVIEGLDGSGKSTQHRLVKQYLSDHKIGYEDIHFPKLNEGHYGRLVAEFLRGEYGAIDQVHPKLVALLFAEDRKEHANTLREWAEAGKIIIADRYVNSNIAFQCAKCKTEAEKEALKKWILEFEYSYRPIPRPHLSLFLDAPLEFVRKALEAERQGLSRDYLDGKTDIHEQSMAFQERVRQEYLKIVEEQEDFHLIPCYDKAGNMLPAEEIHRRIMGFLQPLLFSD